MKCGWDSLNLMCALLTAKARFPKKSLMEPGLFIDAIGIDDDDEDNNCSRKLFREN